MAELATGLVTDSLYIAENPDEAHGARLTHASVNSGLKNQFHAVDPHVAAAAYAAEMAAACADGDEPEDIEGPAIVPVVSAYVMQPAEESMHTNDEATGDKARQSRLVRLGRFATADMLATAQAAGEATAFTLRHPVWAAKRATLGVLDVAMQCRWPYDQAHGRLVARTAELSRHTAQGTTQHYTDHYVARVEGLYAEKEKFIREQRHQLAVRYAARHRTLQSDTQFLHGYVKGYLTERDQAARQAAGSSPVFGRLHELGRTFHEELDRTAGDVDTLNVVERYKQRLREAESEIDASEQAIRDRYNTEREQVHANIDNAYAARVSLLRQELRADVGKLKKSFPANSMHAVASGHAQLATAAYVEAHEAQLKRRNPLERFRDRILHWAVV